MNAETLFMLLLVVSVLVGLLTEGIKKVFEECSFVYKPNIIAGVCAVVVSVAVMVGYTVLADIAWNDKMAVYLITLVFLSWLCAMLGYDKVVQSIAQIKKE